MVLMRKKPRMCTALGASVNFPALEKLLPHSWGSVGFVFINKDLTEIRDKLLGSKLQASVRVGVIALCEVTAPGNNTGLGWEQTSFFQAFRPHL